MKIARLVPANGDENLYPALRNVIQGQPDFATWVASSLCLYYGDALTLSGRRFGGKDPRKPQMIGLWTVAASEQGTGARRDVVLDFFGGGGGLAQAASYGKVKLNEAQSSVSKVPGSGNDLYQVKIGKTRLVWNGRPVGDSTELISRSLNPGWPRAPAERSGRSARRCARNGVGRWLECSAWKGRTIWPRLSRPLPSALSGLCIKAGEGSCDFPAEASSPPGRVLTLLRPGSARCSISSRFSRSGLSPPDPVSHALIWFLTALVSRASCSPPLPFWPPSRSAIFPNFLPRPTGFFHSGRREEPGCPNSMSMMFIIRLSA